MLQLNTTMRSSFATKYLFGFLKSRNICSKSCRLPACLPIYDLKLAGKDDYNQVTQFLRDHFYDDEPLRKGAPPHIVDLEDEKFHLANIARQTCILAVQPSDNIIGAIIGSIRSPNQLANLAEKHGGKWGKILKIWAKAEEESKIFGRFNVSRTLHAYLLAVHRDFRGYGLCSRLIEELATVGRRRKNDMISVDATNVHAACACQKLGMTLVNTLPYANYMDDGGYVIFSPPRPHDAIRTYVKRL